MEDVVWYKQALHHKV